VSPLRRAILGLAILSFAAGGATGFTVSEVVAASEQDTRDPTDDFVARMAREFELTREQQRLIRIIDQKRRAEQDEFWRNQKLTPQAEEQRQSIARRAEERIVHVLEGRQRERYLARLKNDKD